MDKTEINETKAMKATPEVRKALIKIRIPEHYQENALIICNYLTSASASTVENKNSKFFQDSTLPDDVIFVIERLMNGMTSKDTKFQQSYYAVIEILFKTQPILAPDMYKIFCRTKKETEDNGSILVYGALVRSGYWKTSPSILNDIMKNFKMLLNTDHEYETIVGQFVIDILTVAEDAVVINGIYEPLKSLLVQPSENLSNATLWLKLLFCEDKYFKHLQNPEVNFKESAFDKNTFSIIFNKLNESTSENNFASESILKIYFAGLLEYEGEESLVKIVNSVMLPKFPVESCNSSLRMIIYKVIVAMIPLLTKAQSIKAVFGRCLMTDFLVGKNNKSKEVVNYLNSILALLYDKIISNKSDDKHKVQSAILKCLVEPPMSVLFDSSRTLQKSIENLHPKSIQFFTEKLMELITNNHYEKEHKFSSVEAFSEDFIVATSLIGQCLSQPSIVKGSDFFEWRLKQMENLISNIIFRNHPTREASNLRDILRKCCNCGYDNLEKNLEFTDNIVEFIQKSKNLKGASLKCWKAAYKSRSQLKKDVTDPTSLKTQTYMVLYNEICLNILFDVEKSTEILDDVDDCYKGDADDKPSGQFYDIIDLLLAILSKCDHHWRKMVGLLFKNICTKLEPSELKLITDVIDPSKQEDLDETGNSSSDEMDEGIEEDESNNGDDKDEKMDVDDDNEATDEDDSDGTDDDDSDGMNDDEESEDDDNVDKKTKLANLKLDMQKLAGIPEENDIDMDSVPPEEMNSLNKSIGALMKQFLLLKKSNKTRRLKLSKDETEVMHFKARVCDLLDVLVKEAPSFELLSQMIEPLLQAVKIASKDPLQNQLNARLKLVITELSKVKSFARGKSNVKFVITKLTSLFQNFGKASDISEQIGLCCTFLVRNGLILAGDKEKKIQSLMDAFLNQFTLYLNKQITLLPVAFTGVLDLNSSSLLCVMKLLNEKLVEKTSSKFLRLEASKVIVDLLKNKKSISKMPVDTLTKCLQSISSSIIQFFNDIQEEADLRPGVIIAYFDVLRAIRTFCSTDENFQDAIEWQNVKDSISNLNSRVPLSKTKNLRSAVTGISEVLKVQLKQQKPKSTLSVTVKEVKKETSMNGIKKVKNKKSVKSEKKEIDISAKLDDEDSSSDDDDTTYKGMRKINKKIKARKQKTREERRARLLERKKNQKETKKVHKKAANHLKKKQKLWNRQKKQSSLHAFEHISFSPSVAIE